MIEIQTKKHENDILINMADMHPLQVCVIPESEGFPEEVVMRTASSDKLEVMGLSNPDVDECWTCKPEMMVRKLRKGEYYMLKLS